MKKYHKTIIQVEILSEEPYREEFNLTDINYDITEGHCSGVLKEVSRKTLTGKQMANALLDQGSDPEFFRLDENGNELED